MQALNKLARAAKPETAAAPPPTLVRVKPEAARRA
jgi:hypothetical protein